MNIDIVHEDFVNDLGDKLASAGIKPDLSGEGFSASYSGAILEYLPIVLHAILDLVEKMRPV